MFGVLVAEEANLPYQQDILLAIAVTVTLSILAHGLTAQPLTDRYVRWYEAWGEDERRRWSADPLRSTGSARRSGPGRLGLEPDLRRRQSLLLRLGLTIGYCGSISISVCAITAAAAIRANHLRSAGITYHGAHSVLVLRQHLRVRDLVVVPELAALGRRRTRTSSSSPAPRAA